MKTGEIGKRIRRCPCNPGMDGGGAGGGQTCLLGGGTLGSLGERGIQGDIWENWADDGVISELKRAAENYLAIYNLHKIKY